MPRAKRLIRWLWGTMVFLLSVAMLGGVAAYWVWGRSNADAEGGPSGGRPAVPVAVVPVESATLQETVFGVGTLQAAAEVEISPEIAGRVRTIHFREGSFVEEGDLLFELDDERLRRQLDARQAALRAAEVRQENARRVFERQQRLREREVITEEAFEQAQADLDTAAADRERFEAEVALIEREIEDTRILAPFAGAVSHRAVDRGAYVGVGRLMARLYQIDPLELNFWLPERYLGRVRSGQAVAVTIAAYPQRSFEGYVEFVSPAVDESTRQFLVKALVPNEDHLLKPGVFATASVTVGTREDRPVIPEESLVATRRGYMVFVVEEGVAVAREVSTGLRDEGLVEITEGLNVGEQVVREGHLRLSGGETVDTETEEEA